MLRGLTTVAYAADDLPAATKWYTASCWAPSRTSGAASTSSFASAITSMNWGYSTAGTWGS